MTWVQGPAQRKGKKKQIRPSEIEKGMEKVFHQST